MASMPNKLAVESSQQGATTTMFGSDSTSHNNMLTGTASCNSVGSKSNGDNKGVCLSSVGTYDSCAGGSCSNNIVGVQIATKLGVDHYLYRHHELMEGRLQKGSDHPRQLLQGVEGVRLMQHQKQLIAAGGYAHGSLDIAPNIGNSQLQAGAADHHRRSHHDMVLQLQGKSAAASQLLVVANNRGSTKEVTGSDLLQPAADTDHPRTYYDMSLKMTVRLPQDVDASDHRQSSLGDSGGHTTAVEASVVHTQGEDADHRHNERESNTAAARGQLHYVKLSPAGSSMMSMEEQEGLYYGGSSAGGGGGGPGGMSAWEQYNMQTQEGQSMMMMMKKRRLTNEQVKSLEVSFERESKLEAERKKELAQELGLQPRQVAVWFQNRRARFKTKRLERDFDLLKHQYDAVRSEKDKLLAEVAKLKHLLDAQAASKGKLLMPATNDTQGKHDMDEDKKVQHLIPENPKNKKATKATEGTKNQKSMVEASTLGSIEKQKATSNQTVKYYMQQHAQLGNVLSSENLDQTHVHAAILALNEPPKSFSKASFTLEVKPSLHVPHLDHYYYHHHQQQQQHFHNTLSPPTNLSLCSPQQLFLHHMVAMKMEGDNFYPSQHESHSYNDHYNFHHNQYGEDGSESMLCFNSTWNHDP